jgi:hypothetical protein
VAATAREKRVLERLDALLSEADEGHEWSETTGKTAAQNLVTVARALQAQEMPVPVEKT